MTETVQGTQSFSRSMGLLQLIADLDIPPDRSALLSASGLTRPTLYRLLAGLQAEGLITLGEDQRYRPGLRLVGLARRALADLDIRRTARPILEALRDQTGETVHLAVASGNEMVYVDKVESHEVVRMASTIGTRTAMHSSSVGKAWLAALPAAEADEIMSALALTPVTGKTLTSRKALRGQIIEARKAGFASEREENEPGITCYGAAVNDEHGRPLAAISVSVPLFRHKKKPTHYTGPLLERTAEISKHTG